MNAALRLCALAIAPWLLAAAAMLPPRVSSITPCGAQRGTEVDFAIQGERLADPSALLLAQPGLQLVSITKGKTAAECTVRVRIEQDAPLGAHTVRLSAAGGLSNAFLVFVGALPEVLEARKASEPMALTLPTTVSGELRNDESDAYEFSLEAGAHCIAEVEAMRLGRSPIDVAVSVFGPDGALMQRVDDTALGHKDPWVRFQAASAGVHRVLVEPSYAERTNVGAYRLHVGDLPRPTAVLPAVAAADATLPCAFVGDARSMPMEVRTTAAAAQWQPVWAADARGIAPTPVWIRVGGPPAFVESDAGAIAADSAREKPIATEAATAPKDANAVAAPAVVQPTLLPYPCSVTGVVRSPTGVRYRIAAKKGEAFELRALTIGMRSPLDPVVGIRDDKGALLAGDDDGGAPAADALVRYTAPRDMELFVIVRDHLRGHSDEHVYVLECGPQPKSSKARLLTVRGQEPVVVAPQGGRGGMTLQIDDAWQDGGIEFSLRSLPAGVTAEFGRVSKGQNVVPLLLAASPDAALQPSYADLRLRGLSEAADASKSAGYSQTLPLVTVRNDQPIWTVTQDRVPVAVAKKAPVSIALRAPVVPIVRGSSMLVPIEIRRDEGAAFAVRIKPLWTPTGVTAGEITIPKEAQEGMLPIDASANAPLGLFSLAVRASVEHGGEGYELCSGFVDVRVDAPWLAVTSQAVRGVRGSEVALPFTWTKTDAATQPFEGPLRARLVSLPADVAVDELTSPIEAGTASLTLRIGAGAKKGKHNNVVLEVRAPVAGGEVMQRIAIPELRIDEPRKKPTAATQQDGGAR